MVGSKGPYFLECLVPSFFPGVLQWERCLKDLLVHPRRHLKKKKKSDKWNGMDMSFGPKTQRWDQGGHSALTGGEKKERARRQHPTKLVEAASCCLLSPLTTSTGWILKGGTLPSLGGPQVGKGTRHPQWRIHAATFRATTLACM